MEVCIDPKNVPPALKKLDLKKQLASILGKQSPLFEYRVGDDLREVLDGVGYVERAAITEIGE